MIEVSPGLYAGTIDTQKLGDSGNLKYASAWTMTSGISDQTTDLTFHFESTVDVPATSANFFTVMDGNPLDADMGLQLSKRTVVGSLKMTRLAVTQLARTPAAPSASAAAIPAGDAVSGVMIAVPGPRIRSSASRPLSR